MFLEPPRGMDDLLPEEFALKQKIVDIIREVYRKYGYLEVETPTVEYYELFEAKSGEEIRERMFDFYDKSGRRLVLRPEVTASIARLVSTRLKVVAPPLRLGYIADCYRYDEPQWGRRRRFWHGGFELFGSSSPLSDAEILQVSYEVFKKIGLEDHFYKVGHIGILRGILEPYRVDEKAQDRILTSIDRKRFDDAFQMMMERDIEVEAVESIKKLTGSPPIIYRSDGVDSNMIEKTRDILSPWSSASRSFENLLEIVELAVIGGVKADIYIMPGMSRGLEYYTGFIFEQSLPEVDISFNGGGRYDKLVELFGGKPTPAVGCAIGISRILQYLTDKKNIKMAPERPRTLLTFLPEVEKKYVARVLGVLRSENIPVEVDVVERKIASAIDYALKNGFRFLLIVGKSEEVAGEISIRDLEKMVQVRYSLNEVEAIRKMIG